MSDIEIHDVQIDKVVIRTAGPADHAFIRAQASAASISRRPIP